MSFELYARVLDKSGTQLCNTIALQPDHDDVQAILSDAVAPFALLDTPCYIALEIHGRPEGLETGFWSPGGFVKAAHWYKPQKPVASVRAARRQAEGKPPLGAPVIIVGRRNHSISIDDSNWLKAIQIGKGNASEGIREALATYNLTVIQQ